MQMMNNMSNGVIIKEKNGLYSVWIGKASVACRAGSRVRKGGVRLLAGDRVEIELNPDGSGFITAALPRTNHLTRPHVANVGAFVIVVAATSPQPYPYNIDKLTVMAEKAGIETVLAINKCDLGSDAVLTETYGKAGYKCFSLSAVSGMGVDSLRDYLRGKTAVFAGASGVGKSSLLNALYPGLNAETGELSRKIVRGKNTTRHTEFFAVEENTFIADTPGFTMLDEDKLGVEDKTGVFDCFPEFAPHFGNCRFRGCTHLKEDGCAVIRAVKEGSISATRHESYVKLYTALGALNKYS